MKILLVEDDVVLGDLIKKSLEDELFNVVWVKTALDIDSFIKSSKPDLIILDLSLPKKDGVVALREIRKSYNIPIIVSTARDDDQSIDDCFKLGADDYIVKPFRIKELVLRINAINRRISGIASNIIEVENFKLNNDNHVISYKGQELILSNNEYVILKSFIINPNKIFSRIQLENQISSLTNNIESNTVEVHVHSIRKKTEHDVIKTIRGLGYKLGKKQ